MNPPPAAGGAPIPAPPDPNHYFTAFCQNPNCRAQRGGGKIMLGQFHIPAPGGVVRYACYLCRCVSEFKVTVVEGIQASCYSQPRSRT